VVTTGDGVHLAGDLYLPTGGGPFPTVLIRTPYGKASKRGYAEDFVEAGYAVVVQDTRGKNESEGEFDILAEAGDGHETVARISQQAWSDGSVGLFGASYLGYAALAAAREGHPAVKAVFAMSGIVGSHQILRPGGAFHQGFALPWALAFDGDGQTDISGVNFPRLFAARPLSGALAEAGLPTRLWGVFTGEPAYAGTHVASDVGDVAEVQVPVLLLSGWNDFLGEHSFTLYERIDANPWHREQGALRLIMGPWKHDQYQNGGTRVGDVDYGPFANMDGPVTAALAVRWFDRWLKQADNGAREDPKVRFFVEGRNRWATADAWPPAGVQPTSYYLGSHTGANSLSGDGFLAAEAGSGRETDTYLFNPADPVPTTGGANFHWYEETLGPRDQREVEKRDDVLVYTTGALDSQLTIAGPVRARLFVTSEGSDTDFTAKLVDVHPEGSARNVVDGILRARYRHSMAEPARLEPGAVTELEIDLGNAAHVFGAGHRIRLEVSSSNYPKFNLNPNTGAEPEQSTEFVAVEQVVHHSSAHPSALILPVAGDLRYEAPQDRFMELLAAVQDGDREAVRSLVEAGVDVDGRDERGLTPLMWAVKLDDRDDMVRVLSELGADVDLASDDGNAALAMAAGAGNLAGVASLLAAGADADHPNERGTTALIYAAHRGHTEVVDVLIANGADPAIRNAGGNSALLVAAAAGRLGPVEVLLSHGAAPDVSTEHGTTPLLWASQEGHADVVRVLIEAGASVDAQDKDGDTGLILAAKYGHEGVVELLLAAGADRALVNTSGETALSAAGSAGGSGVVEQLQ
jgi:putative CocE/NonD family hydrolase